MRIVICLVCGLLLVGCESESEREFRKLVDDARAISDEAGLVAEVQKLASAVSQQDLESLKGLCSDVDCAEYAAIMGCYYDVFAAEQLEGVEPARKLLAARLAEENLPPARRQALEALDSYFQFKGSVRTVEMAVGVLAIAMEVKYPHGRGSAPVMIIARQLNLIPAETNAPPLPEKAEE